MAKVAARVTAAFPARSACRSSVGSVTFFRSMIVDAVTYPAQDGPVGRQLHRQ